MVCPRLKELKHHRREKVKVGNSLLPENWARQDAN